MEQFLMTYKRLLLALVVALCLWISGEVSMVYGLPFTGLSFSVVAIATLLFTFFNYNLHKKEKQPFATALKRWELYVFTLVALFLCITGAIEAQPNNPDFAAVYEVLCMYTIVLLLILVRNTYLQKKQQAPLSRSFVKNLLLIAFVIGFARILIVIEEYGDSDALVIAAFFYFPLVFFLLARWIFKQVKMIINLKNEKATTELMHLKSQVNPHFFFNMLNNLYGWVDKDPVKAKELIISLSEMMRYSIYEGDKNTVSIEDEVRYMEQYIELHRMRYHKEIDISFTTNSHVSGVQIMPLLFIILLENAFKHGVENLREDAFVKLHLAVHKQQVIFEIENNFDAQEIPSKPGIGIDNLKRRLELVYPKKHTLTLEATNSIYKATLILDL